MQMLFDYDDLFTEVQSTKRVNIKRNLPKRIATVVDAGRASEFFLQFARDEITDKDFDAGLETCVIEHGMTKEEIERYFPPTPQHQDNLSFKQLENEEKRIIIYGFTRTEAIRQLGWDTIRANVYEDLSKFDASVLNATNNSTHNQLTVWERALQIKKMRTDGVKVDSTDVSEETITQIFNMGRRNVFNWVKVVDYNCPALHKAIAEENVGLKHALLFIDYPQTLVVEMLERCIEEEWSSKVLDLKLKSATVARADDELSGIRQDESATLHSESDGKNDTNVVSGDSATVAHSDGELSGIRQDESATLHTQIKMNLDKAANMMLACTADEILSLTEDNQRQLNDGIRLILEVLLNSS